MSDSTFYRKKIVVDNIEATEINGVQGNIIDPEVNEVGQVLTITNALNKEVAFQDPQGGTPPTLGEPDGYVLAIKDNTTGELEWKQDAQGSIPDPLVLSGANNANKFQVKNNAGDNKFTVDTVNSEVEVDDATVVIRESGSGTQATLSKTATETIIGTNENISIVGTGSSVLNIETGKAIFKEYNDTERLKVQNQLGISQFTVNTTDSQVQLTALNNRVEGADDEKKFGVYTNADGVNGIVEVSTQNSATGLVVQGQNAPKKFQVKNNAGAIKFGVNTLADRVDISADTIEISANGIAQVSGNVATVIQSVSGDIIIDSTTGNANTNIDANNISLTTASSVEVDGADNANKFQVKNNVGDELFNVDTLNKKLELNRGNIKTGEIVVLDTAETLPVGVQSAVNMKLEYDAGGLGNGEFVGYVASNGPASMYNVVSANQTGLFLFADTNAGIQTTASTMSINAIGTTNVCDIDFKGNVNIRNGVGNCSISVGDQVNNRIVISSTETMTLGSDNGNISHLAPADFQFAYPTVENVPSPPTLQNELTPKLYVDTKVGNFFVGTADTANVNSGSIVPTGLGTLSVPANGFAIGDSFHLTMAGDLTFAGGDTITITLLANAVVIGTIVVDTEATATPPNPWECEMDFTIRSLGVLTGAVAVNFDFTYIGTNQNVFVGSRSVEVNSLDTTIANTLDVNAVCSNGADSIRTRLMYLKKVY